MDCLLQFNKTKKQEPYLIPVFTVFLKCVQFGVHFKVRFFLYNYLVYIFVLNITFVRIKQMRKYRLPWSIAAFGFVAVAYGTYSLVSHLKNDDGIFLPGLLMLIAGALALLTLLVLILIDAFKRIRNKELIETPINEDSYEEAIKVEEEEEKHISENPINIDEDGIENVDEYEEEEFTPSYTRSYSSSSYSYSTIYVKEIGYGPVLRIDGSRILDMRNNVYYHIENNIVIQDGYGPAFEIRGNQIKDVYGSYLFEISGNNINKVFGGFYASISGNYITLFDSSRKYETTESLSRNQILIVAALLFGRY